MDIILVWSLLSAAVASAAISRGRSGAGWLLLAIVASPLLAGLLVLVLPQLSEKPINAGAVNDVSGNERPANEPSTPGRSPEVAKKPVFQPDGVYAGIPYKVSEAGAVEVMLSVGRVRFQSMEQFLALALKDRATPSTSPEHHAR